MVERMKKAVEPFYTDRCTVYEKEPVYENGATQFCEKVKYDLIPCRVSVKAYLFGENAGSENGKLLKMSKKVKIFMPPEYEIKPGSRLEIVSHDKKCVYGKSGEMNLYSSHNEVMVELGKDYA